MAIQNKIGDEMQSLINNRKSVISNDEAADASYEEYLADCDKRAAEALQRDKETVMEKGTISNYLAHSKKASVTLPETGSPQYLRAKDSILKFFDELDYGNGRKLFLAIGRKQGFYSQLSKVIARLNRSTDMTSLERFTLRAWIECASNDAWDYFKSRREEKNTELSK